MALTSGRTKDGHPAVKIRHMTGPMLPGRNSPLAIFSLWPAKNPENCIREDFSSFDRTVESEKEFVSYMEELAEHYDEVSRLGRTEIAGSIPSYWGPTQTRRAYYPGIESVTTAGHGGFIVSPEIGRASCRERVCQYV